MDLLDVVMQFVGQLAPGLFPLAPDPSAIGGFEPDLSRIWRDEQGVIMQHSGEKDKELDGGDSAHKTGTAAFCGSRQDQQLLAVFETAGVMVRHPRQEPWNNWRNSSRDQLMAYIAGCWRAGNSDVCARLLAAHAARLPPFTCQNTEADYPGTAKNPPIGDPLAPHDVMALRIASGDGAAYLDLLGQVSLQVAIELADKDVNAEKNQLILISILCGRIDLYTQVHTNYKENIMAYWAGWRDQAQIGEALIAVIDKELGRYGSRAMIPLLPNNLIQFLKGLDPVTELRNFDVGRIVGLQLKVTEAMLKDQADFLLNVAGLAIADAIARMKKLGVAIEGIAKAFAEINQAPNAIRAALEAVGFPADLVSRALQAAFPGIPHADFAGVPHADFAPIPHADVAAIHTDIGAPHTDSATGHSDGSTGHADGSTGHGDGTVGVHGDTGGIHSDIGAGHADGGGVHADVGAGHTDAEVSSHIDTPAHGHVDTPPSLHVDTP